jgi:hypothetical protein
MMARFLRLFALSLIATFLFISSTSAQSPKPLGNLIPLSVVSFEDLRHVNALADGQIFSIWLYGVTGDASETEGSPLNPAIDWKYYLELDPDFVNKPDNMWGWLWAVADEDEESQLVNLLAVSAGVAQYDPDCPSQLYAEAMAGAAIAGAAALKEKQKWAAGKAERERQAKELMDKEEEYQRQRAADSAARRKAEKAALAKLATRWDAFEEVRWYFDRDYDNIVNRRNCIVAYIASKEGYHPSLRGSINFVASDWLFITSYRFKIDGEYFELTPNYDEVKRDNEAYRVWEWYESSSPELLEILGKIARSNSASYRMVGDTRYADHEVSHAEREAIARVLAAYQSLGDEWHDSHPR